MDKVLWGVSSRSIPSYNRRSLRPGRRCRSAGQIHPEKVRDMGLHNSSGDGPEPPAAVNGAFCVWLMGLSASGKTTLAQLLAQALSKRGFKVEVLDGDIVRTTLSKGLGFTSKDRVTNLRNIATMAQNLVDQQVVTIVAAICPYHAIREEVRATIGKYIEVYLNCPLEVCISRDPKGLYRQALAGEIQHFTGIDDVFETPMQPDIEITTHREAPEASLARILRGLAALQHISPDPGAPPEQASEPPAPPQLSRRVAR
jgi:adenylylsulfate kinase